MSTENIAAVPRKIHAKYAKNPHYREWLAGGWAYRPKTACQQTYHARTICSSPWCSRHGKGNRDVARRVCLDRHHVDGVPHTAKLPFPELVPQTLITSCVRMFVTRLSEKLNILSHWYVVHWLWFVPHVHIVMYYPGRIETMSIRKMWLNVLREHGIETKSVPRCYHKPVRGDIEEWSKYVFRSELELPHWECPRDVVRAYYRFWGPQGRPKKVVPK